MTWSQRRKLTYVSAALVCIAVVAGSIVFRLTQTPPTCFDRKKNGIETGIDCGGACNFYCPNDLSIPKIRWVRVFTVAPGIVHAVAYIEHSNAQAAVEKVAYEFKIYDEKNDVITTKDGTTYIGSFGRTAIVEALIPVGNTVAKTARFSFTGPIRWQKIPSVFSQAVIKTDRQLMETFPNGTRLSVLLENQSNFSFRDMDVVAIIYDRDDNALAVSKSILPSLSAQEKKTVYFTWSERLKDRAARIEVIARINPFDSSRL